MPISVISQMYVFLFSVLGGMVIALIYDIFRIKRKAIKTGSIIIHIEDLLFWLIVAIIMFSIVYYSNEGEIRGYIFIGTVLGIILYILLLSRIVVNSSMFVIRVVSKIFKILWIIVTYPFRIIFKILSLPAGLLLKVIKKMFRGAKGISRNRMAKVKIWGRLFKNIRKKF